MAQGGGESSRTSIVLLSKTGGGKSSLANGILSTDEFQVSRGMLSGTAYCKCISTHARGRDLIVVDTPGAMDVSNKETAKQEIMRAISFCPDGFDIFLVVVKCDTRFTDEETQAIEVAAGMFGAKFYDHAIVVFSHGDDYDNNEAEFKSELEGKIRPAIKYLDELLRKCDKAVQERQIGQLKSLIDSLMTRNRKVKYTNEHFQSEKRKREDEEKQKQAAAKEDRMRQEAAVEQRIRVAIENERSTAADTAEAERKAEMQREMLMALVGGVMKLGFMAMQGAMMGDGQQQLVPNAGHFVRFVQLGHSTQPLALKDETDSDSD